MTDLSLYQYTYGNYDILSCFNRDKVIYNEEETA
jgi:hypothetical protein